MKSDAELRSIAESSTILRGLVGSTVHGLVLAGKDDRDEMGVCVEPRRYVVGFGKFEQWVYRSAAEREGHAGARSAFGDLDLTVFSLRKWAQLALQGNPTVLLLLYLPVRRPASRGPKPAVSFSSWRPRLRRGTRAGGSWGTSKRSEIG